MRGRRGGRQQQSCAWYQEQGAAWRSLWRAFAYPAVKAWYRTQARREQREIEKGQRTAVLTGAISIFLGVAWLAIVFLLDSRGNTLEPPPPEAFL